MKEGRREVTRCTHAEGGTERQAMALHNTPMLGSPYSGSTCRARGPMLDHVVRDTAQQPVLLPQLWMLSILHKRMEKKWKNLR